MKSDISKKGLSQCQEDLSKEINSQQQQPVSAEEIQMNVFFFILQQLLGADSSRLMQLTEKLKLRQGNHPSVTTN